MLYHLRDSGSIQTLEKCGGDMWLNHVQLSPIKKDKINEAFSKVLLFYSSCCCGDAK